MEPAPITFPVSFKQKPNSFLSFKERFEIKLLFRLFKPEYFAPYHGEYRMLKTHTDIAKECGIPKLNTFVLENGVEYTEVDKLEYNNKKYVLLSNIKVVTF